MKLYIKYMVSIRCKMVVKAELDKLGIRHSVVELGEVEIFDPFDEAHIAALKASLLKSGLELMEDRKAILIQRIKNLIIEMVHYADELPSIKNSVYISQALRHDYTYLANLFSETTGTTIENFIILHKIEKVKELLVYNELNLTEISYKLNYSSVAHLSNQFKKITGLTPSHFKKIGQKRRQPLEDV